MKELIQNYDFEVALHGNTYEAVTFNLPEEDSFILTNAKIYMQLRKKPGNAVAAEFSTANNLIKIAGNYSFQFIEQVIEVSPDTYFYDILIVFADGRRETYVGGKWEIEPVITHKG